MKIALGTDHAGFDYKEKIKAHLIATGHDVVDFGTHSAESCDYPEYVRPAAEAVARGECERAIVLGGSGNGEAMVANKVRGVRCGLAWNVESAVKTRQHNESNALSLGQRMIPEELVLEIVQAWLDAVFEGGRHARRVAQIEAN